MDSSNECIFALKEGYTTRSRTSRGLACHGRVRLYTGKDARQRGFAHDVSLCYRHSSRQSDESLRCAAVFSNSECAGRLRPCPQRLNEVLDDLSDALSAYLCKKHSEDIESMPDVLNHPRYTPRQNVLYR